jgi:hypothetical protein
MQCKLEDTPRREKQLDFAPPTCRFPYLIGAKVSMGNMVFLLEAEVGKRNTLRDLP